MKAEDWGCRIGLGPPNCAGYGRDIVDGAVRAVAASQAAVPAHLVAEAGFDKAIGAYPAVENLGLSRSISFLSRQHVETAGAMSRECTTRIYDKAPVGCWSVSGGARHPARSPELHLAGTHGSKFAVELIILARGNWEAVGVFTIFW